MLTVEVDNIAHVRSYARRLEHLCSVTIGVTTDINDKNGFGGDQGNQRQDESSEIVHGKVIAT